jgi:hypothetical protein
MLDVLEQFIQDFEAELKEAQLGNPLMEHIFGILLQLLKNKQSNRFLRLFATFVDSFGEAICMQV